MVRSDASLASPQVWLPQGDIQPPCDEERPDHSDDHRGAQEPEVEHAEQRAHAAANRQCPTDKPAVDASDEEELQSPRKAERCQPDVIRTKVREEDTYP